MTRKGKRAVIVLGVVAALVTIVAAGFLVRRFRTEEPGQSPELEALAKMLEAQRRALPPAFQEVIQAVKDRQQHMGQAVSPADLNEEMRATAEAAWAALDTHMSDPRVKAQFERSSKDLEDFLKTKAGQEYLRMLQSSPVRTVKTTTVRTTP